MPGKFVCQTSVLLEVTKTCETARMLQPKHERGEGLGKEKRLFPVVLLFCFRIRVDSFFFRHRNETEIKLVDLPRLPSIFFTWRFWGEFPKFSYSKWFSLGCREGSLHFPKPGCSWRRLPRLPSPWLSFSPCRLAPLALTFPPHTIPRVAATS